ncbi:MAG: hypothetical protein LBR77_00630 [Lachnospiraceae bacterium]|jgi:hypothetical protein|nr:hypothetical protein [Lachnospiraceae bacterium]
MKRIKGFMAVCVLFAMVCAWCPAAFGSVGQPVAREGSGGGGSPSTGTEFRTSTDVYAGVVTDYMGQIRFIVYIRGTTTPIPDASIDIYIPSIDRYVFVGNTDANGILDLDFAYTDDEAAPFQNLGVPAAYPPGSTAQVIPEYGGAVLRYTYHVLYLASNQIKYKVYKAWWNPYPSYQEAEVELYPTPKVYISYLYREDSDSEIWFDTKDDGSSIGSGVSGGKDAGGLPDTGDASQGSDLGSLPKTGVESHLNLLLLLLGLLLIAVGFVLWLFAAKDEDDDEDDDEDESGDGQYAGGSPGAPGVPGMMADVT